jgi:hypothetical protein
MRQQAKLAKKLHSYCIKADDEHDDEQQQTTCILGLIPLEIK